MQMFAVQRLLIALTWLTLLLFRSCRGFQAPSPLLLQERSYRTFPYHYDRVFHRPLSVTLPKRFSRMSLIQVAIASKDLNSNSNEISEHSDLCCGDKNSEHVVPPVQEVEICLPQEQSQISESRSYWSTGAQLIQAGAVGATTGLLVALFKLVSENIRLCPRLAFLSL